MFNIENIGYNYKESKTFKINRPNGSHNYLFIFFPSEVTISVENVLNDVKPNSCIIYTPDCPQLYYNEKSGFVNHWVHFTNDNAEPFFKNIQIPMNVPFYINDYSFIPLFFKKCRDGIYEKRYVLETEHRCNHDKQFHTDGKRISQSGKARRKSV